MQTQIQIQTLNKTNYLLDGFFSVYDLTPKVSNPYKDKDIGQSLAQHWSAVGGYLQNAMNDFDNEQKNNKSR